MKPCTICREVYYRQTLEDPAEPCICGEMATGTPWTWDGWRGVKNAALYWVAQRCFALGNYLVMRGYK